MHEFLTFIARTMHHNVSVTLIVTKSGFQIDASLMALSANKIAAMGLSVHQKNAFFIVSTRTFLRL